MIDEITNAKYIDFMKNCGYLFNLGTRGPRSPTNLSSNCVPNLPVQVAVLDFTKLG